VTWPLITTTSSSTVPQTMGSTGPVGVLAGAVTLAPGQRPWDIGWESRDGIDDCDHAWQVALVTTHDGRGNEAVIRCARCYVPRCGHSTDRDPCMLRRHHKPLLSAPDTERRHLPLSQWLRRHLPPALDRDSVERWLDS